MSIQSFKQNDVMNRLSTVDEEEQKYPEMAHRNSRPSKQTSDIRLTVANTPNEKKNKMVRARYTLHSIHESGILSYMWLLSIFIGAMIGLFGKVPPLPEYGQDYYNYSHGHTDATYQDVSGYVQQPMGGGMHGNINGLNLDADRRPNDSPFVPFQGQGHVLGGGDRQRRID